MDSKEESKKSKAEDGLRAWYERHGLIPPPTWEEWERMANAHLAELGLPPLGSDLEKERRARAAASRKEIEGW